MAKIVSTTMTKRVHPELMQIEPNKVAISTVNRLFSAMQTHNAILTSFKVNGHDPFRPKAGVCCEVRSPARLKELRDFNQNLTDQTPLMPAFHPNRVEYEALSANHYNTALRLVAEGRHSPAGDLAMLRAEDASLADAATNGHYWIVLPESLDEETKSTLCQWFNQDQNENQTITDGEMVRMALCATKDYLAKKTGDAAAPGADAGAGAAAVVTIQPGPIALAACLMSPVKMRSDQMNGFCRWVCQMCSENNMHLVKEFLDFWSSSVDPKSICVQGSFFDMVSKCKFLNGRQYGRVRMHMVMAMYTQDGAQARPPPNPSISALIGTNDTSTLEKAMFLVPAIVKALDDLHDVYKPLLVERLKLHEANALVVTCGPPPQCYLTRHWST